MLVLTQISFPGERVQANGNEVSAVAVTESETASKEKAEEGTIVVKSKSTEQESKKTTEDTEAEEQKNSSAKEEKNTADKESTDKKEAADEESQNKEDSDEETKKKESSEKVESSEGTSEEQKEEKNTDQTENEKSENKSDENVATTEVDTETPPVAISGSEIASPVKNSVSLSGEPKDGDVQEIASYTVTFQPMDGETIILGATVTLQSSTDQKAWSEISTETGKYNLPVKSGDDYYFYKFKVTSDGYYEYNSESFSLTPDDTKYFNISTLTGEEITIRPVMTIIPEQYQVIIQPVDKEGQSVSGFNTTLQSSTDQNTWETIKADSSGIYQLSVRKKTQVCFYKFSITATNYYTYSSDSFSLTQENTYFSLSSVTDRAFTIQPEMEKKTDQYRVTIKAIDENGDEIMDAVVSMQWSVDIYGSYQQNPVEPGVYDLNVKKGNDWLYYQFSIMAKGYTFYNGAKFRFGSGWPNPYFDADTVSSSFTITVQMISTATTLSNAKENAVSELQKYKKLENYRQEEQKQIKSIVETYTEKIEKATTVDSVNWCLNYAKSKLDRLKTKIEYEDEEYRGRIYFQSSDGQKSYVNEYGVVTLTNIDSGNFYITHPDGSLYQNNEWDAKWRCVYEYRDLDHPESTAFSVIVGTYGQYAGKFIGKYDATVEVGDLGREIHFIVRVIDGRVDQLRVYVDGNDVSSQTIQVMGSEKNMQPFRGD